MMTKVFLISFLFISLESYYHHTLGISLFPYIGAVIFILNNNKIHRDIYLHFFLALVLYVIVLTYFVSLKENVQIGSMLAFILSASLLLFRIKKEMAKSIITYYLIIHSFFFLIQFISYYLGGITLDFLYWFNGDMQRTAAGSFQMFGMKLFRATGLFVEPSTFFIFFAPIVAIKWLLIDEKLTLINAIYIIISLLTFSSLGFIFWVFIFILHFFNNLLNFEIKMDIKSIFIFLIICYIFYIVSDYFIFFLDEKLGIDENSTTNADRLGFLYYLLNRDIIINIFGIGFTHEITSYIVNDSSLIVYMFYKFGIIGCLFLLTLFLFISEKKAKIVFVAILLTKLKLTYPFFWFVYLLLKINYKS